MFKNLKIGVRLGLGFGLVTLLLAIVSAISLMRISDMTFAIDDITNDRIPKVEMSNEAMTNVLIIARALRNVVLSSDKMFEKAQLEIIANARKRNTELLDKLKPMLNTEKGKEYYEKIVLARTKYSAALDKLLPLADSSSPQYNSTKATEYVLGEYTTLANEYNQQIKTFADFQKETAQISGKHAAEVASAAKNLLLILSVITILLAIALAFWLIRSITEPTNKVVDAANKMAVGDFNFKLDIDSQDEMGRLAKAVEAIQTSVQRMVADAALLTKAAVDGKLATRADAKQHQGDFQKVVTGVNTTLDAVIGPLNVTAKYVDDIAKGVIPPIITDSYNGDFNIIKGNLNNLVKMMSDLLAQTDIIIQGAANGELDKRANADLFVGGWNKLVSGVNQAITNIVNPMNVTADYVDKVAKGIIPAVISTEYKGQYNVIKNNLNNLVKMMSDLLAQTDIIIQGAANGELKKRANADLFVGGWKKLVTGVNEAITNIVNPLNVTANYVDRISKGDIPPKISDPYSGDYNIIKNNLNTCIDAVNALVADADLLTKAAAEGKLETRADASKHQGDFQKIVRGVNDTLDNVVGPINEVRRIMGAMSEGDLSQTISTAYRGDFDELKSAINQTVVKLVGIIGEVRTAADNLTNAAGQVSATAQSLSQSSSEQAASVEETTSSMEQMTASISQNTENAKVTDGMASKAAREAAEGGEAVSKTVDDMKSIASKIGIIDDIAYQTNLLALNAAIEAARAGDHGKGFAVVAAEVRKLAERSQVAAQEIGNLASSSVKQAERAGTLLTEMVPTIRKTSDLVQEIASASAEQSSGVAQINGAMGQLNQATQQNASASEQLAATAEELGAQAEQLQQTMTFFRLDDNPRSSVRKVAPVARSGGRTKPQISARAAAVQVNEGDFERY